mmetsp:Transcript_20457/g.56753  ORF Transcript_20457/g.56753 Transcript_20457/m.56753 type:complete len:719 (-) Transcript_20457:122-2278(-)
MFNSTTAINETFHFDPTEHYRDISGDFEAYHKDPINVALHLITTPLGLIGAFALLHRYTKSSSAAISLAVIYLLSLAPAVPNGVFAGTAFLCGIIVLLARKVRFGAFSSILLICFSYLLQDLAHMGTGEETYQSTYSDGGHIDLGNPVGWASMLLEHTYYLLPLCVHVALPFLIVPAEIRSILEDPLPVQMQRLNAFAFLLGPLVAFALGSYCLDSKNKFCFFPGAPYFHRMILTNLLSKDEKINRKQEKSTVSHPTAVARANPSGRFHESRAEDMSTVRRWALKQDPAVDKSTHYWYKELDGEVKEAFDRCATSTQVEEMFRTLFSNYNYAMDVLPGMNEIYITGPRRDNDPANSDNVFYSRHVDGPFGLLPFVSVYRCIVGLDKNEMVTTHFPLANWGKNACTGDVLAFDFNREVHYITRDESKAAESDDFRVVLKLHYCIYPRVLTPLGWLMSWLNTMYNKSFRALFLKTIDPKTPYEHFLAWNVNFNTYLLDRIETVIGQRNLLYIIFCLGMWRATGVYEVFFAMTSIVHYFRYITTFYIRRGIDFGSFKRDVMLFKMLALGQIFYHYFFPSTVPFVLDWISILITIAGYAVSSMAAGAIGIDRTYFAAELGLVEPKWIDQFPYGYIPHPMIVSQVVALLGLYKAEHFRTEWPYVVPIHITLYLAHMLQEHFNIYSKGPASCCNKPYYDTAPIAAAPHDHILNKRSSAGKHKVL